MWANKAIHYSKNTNTATGIAPLTLCLCHCFSNLLLFQRGDRKLSVPGLKIQRFYTFCPISSDCLSLLNIWGSIS